MRSLLAGHEVDHRGAFGRVEHVVHVEPQHSDEATRRMLGREPRRPVASTAWHSREHPRVGRESSPSASPSSTPRPCASSTTRNAFELLAATILSAQSTDARVNMVTPALFARYPDPQTLAGADPSELEEIVRSTGFYQTKAKNLIGMAQALLERYDGEVPTGLDDLVTLPGVGRKTGNVVRTRRVRSARSARRHPCRAAEPPARPHPAGRSGEGRTRARVVPPADAWGPFSLRTILHGRRVCDAKKPRCADCVLEDVCPSSSLPRRRGAANTTKA